MQKNKSKYNRNIISILYLNSFLDIFKYFNVFFPFEKEKRIVFELKIE